MAGARDIKRHRKKVLEEQRKRNREAAEARDERVSEMEEVAEMDPVERRRRLAERRQNAVRAVRDGHRVRYEEVEEAGDEPQDEEAKMDRAPVEDKMDRSGVEDKREKAPEASEEGSRADEGGEDDPEEGDEAEGPETATVDPLDGVQFDSDRALELARDAPLTREQILESGVEPSGAEGGYLAGDVRKILG